MCPSENAKTFLNGAFGADFDVYGQQKLVSKSKTPGTTRSVADYVPQLGTDVVIIGVLYTSANVLRKCTLDSACLKAKNDIVTASTNLGVSFFRSPAPGEQHIHLRLLRLGFWILGDKQPNQRSKTSP